MHKCKLIAFEGADQQGKHTQALMLKETLESYGFKVALVEAPVKSPITYRMIYRFLKTGTAMSHPNLFQLVQVLNKLFFEFRLASLKSKNDFIIFDRWILSTEIYGKVSGAVPFMADFSKRFLTTPDLNIVLIGKTKRRNTVQDVLEQANMFQAAVQSCYIDAARKNPSSISVISGDDMPGIVSQNVVLLLALKNLL